MIESFYVGAYWYDGVQSAEQCARQLLLLMGQLKKYDPIFSEWYITGKTRAEALAAQVALEDPQSVAMLASMCIALKQQAGGGFRFSLWNGLDDENACGITSFCGAQSKRFANNCILTIPYGEKVSSHLLEMENMCSLVDLVASIWVPRSVKVSSQVIDDLVEDTGLSRELGWATFRDGFSPKMGDLPASGYVKECGIARAVVFASSDARSLSSSVEGLASLIAINDVYKRAPK